MPSVGTPCPLDDGGPEQRNILYCHGLKVETDRGFVYRLHRTTIGFQQTTATHVRRIWGIRDTPRDNPNPARAQLRWREKRYTL